jgi:hypothetical protein
MPSRPLLGTLFEWYDFYLYGSLAVFFGSKFFPPGNETAQLLASLATFGAGFGGMFIVETRNHKIDTDIPSESSDGDSFDWTSVLIGIAGSYLLLVIVGPYLPAISALGVGATSVGGALFTLIPAFAAGGLPMIFFRLSFSRPQSLLRVFGGLAVALVLAAVVYPLFFDAGGAAKFFAATAMIAVYAAVLVLAYSTLRPKPLSA